MGVHSIEKIARKLYELDNLLSVVEKGPSGLNLARPFEVPRLVQSPKSKSFKEETIFLSKMDSFLKGVTE